MSLLNEARRACALTGAGVGRRRRRRGTEVKQPARLSSLLLQEPLVRLIIIIHPARDPLGLALAWLSHPCRTLPSSARLLLLASLGLLRVRPERSTARAAEPGAPGLS
jgi:hypothetical protein